MELKKLYINSKVYLKSIDKKIDVNEENKKLLLSCKDAVFLFDKPKNKKNAKDKPSAGEHNSSNSEGEADA